MRRGTVTRVHGEALEQLDDYLAIVVSLHTYVDYLLTRLIEHTSAFEKVAKVIGDHRTYTFSVKLTMAAQMRLIDSSLYENIKKLTELRNDYAHEIDVDLAEKFDRGFVATDGTPAFADVRSIRERMNSEPRAGVEALLRIRDVTFGWLLTVCASHGLEIP